MPLLAFKYKMVSNSTAVVIGRKGLMIFEGNPILKEILVLDKGFKQMLDITATPEIKTFLQYQNCVLN